MVFPYEKRPVHTRPQIQTCSNCVFCIWKTTEAKKKKKIVRARARIHLNHRQMQTTKSQCIINNRLTVTVFFGTFYVDFRTRDILPNQWWCTEMKLGRCFMFKVHESPPTGQSTFHGHRGPMSGPVSGVRTIGSKNTRRQHLHERDRHAFYPQDCARERLVNIVPSFGPGHTYVYTVVCFTRAFDRRTRERIVWPRRPLFALVDDGPPLRSAGPSRSTRNRLYLLSFIVRHIWKSNVLSFFFITGECAQRIVRPLFKSSPVHAHAFVR